MLLRFSWCIADNQRGVTCRIPLHLMPSVSVAKQEPPRFETHRDSLIRAGLMTEVRAWIGCSYSCSNQGKSEGREKKGARHVCVLHTHFCFTKGWNNLHVWQKRMLRVWHVCDLRREHTPRFCLSTLMQADNGRGLGSHEFNQCCPKPSESH